MFRYRVPRPLLVPDYLEAAADYSAGLPRASLGRVYLVYYSGTAYLVEWRASLRSAVAGPADIYRSPDWSSPGGSGAIWQPRILTQVRVLRGATALAAPGGY
jgi:hypothetical protein